MYPHGLIDSYLMVHNLVGFNSDGPRLDLSEKGVDYIRHKYDMTVQESIKWSALAQIQQEGFKVKILNALCTVIVLISVFWGLLWAWFLLRRLMESSIENGAHSSVGLELLIVENPIVEAKEPEPPARVPVQCIQNILLQSRKSRRPHVVLVPICPPSNQMLIQHILQV